LADTAQKGLHRQYNKVTSFPTAINKGSKVKAETTNIAHQPQEKPKMKLLSTMAIPVSGSVQNYHQLTGGSAGVTHAY